MESSIVPTHIVAVIHGTHAYISLKTPLSYKSLSRFCICIVGAVEVNYSQLHHSGTTTRKGKGNTPHTKYLFYTGNIETESKEF